MNFFFLLKPALKSLDSEIDIVNASPSPIFSSSKSKKLILHYFYSNGNEWIFNDICSLGANETITIKNRDLNLDLNNHSVFFSLNKEKQNNAISLKDEDYHMSKIAWRANIKIKSKNSYTSYQGEYPGGMIDKNLTLVSCSPMIQNHPTIKNFFYLVNLNASPEIKEFNLEILNSDKKVISNLKCYTNKINLIDLNNLKINFNSNMYIFTSKNGGGIPIYFSIDNSERMSLEHTHPPTEYILHGNRFLFQRLKKSFWKS